MSIQTRGQQMEVFIPTFDCLPEIRLPPKVYLWEHINADQKLHKKEHTDVRYIIRGCCAVVKCLGFC